MKKILLASLVLAVFLVAIVGSYVFGAMKQREKLGLQLESAQAMLWFNHIQSYREIEADLTKDCPKEALEKTKIAIDKEMELLSDYYKQHKDTWVNKYINDRDAELLSRLPNFKSKYGNSWSVPKCNK